MLKSSAALDRFHWILKMKRRVGGWGKVEGGRGWTEKKAAKQKNVRTGAISPQPCNAAETLGWIYNSFAGRERKGEVVKGGLEGGWRRRGRCL